MKKITKQKELSIKKKQLVEDIKDQLDRYVFILPGTRDSPIKIEWTLSSWFNGGDTTKGLLHNINTEDDLTLVLKLIKIELMELHEDLVYDWNKESGDLLFYLQFNKYISVLSRMKKSRE